jgi:hypothetical protein
MMMIEIDGFYVKALLIGKKYTKRKLKEVFRQAKKHSIYDRDFPSLFCRLNNFDVIPYSKEIEGDFVLDIDTERVYIPSYLKF